MVICSRAEKTYTATKSFHNTTAHFATDACMTLLWTQAFSTGNKEGASHLVLAKMSLILDVQQKQRYTQAKTRHTTWRKAILSNTTWLIIVAYLQIIVKYFVYINKLCCLSLLTTSLRKQTQLPSVYFQHI